MCIVLKRIVRSALRLTGYEIVRYGSDAHLDEFIVEMLTREHCDLILDIGANEGQFAQSVLSKGCRIPIVSIEPLTSVHSRLESNSKRFRNWSVYPPVAIGSAISTMNINVSKNTVSSSLLNMEPLHLKVEKSSAYTGTQPTDVVTIDHILAESPLVEKSDILLKVDTQGFELEVLRGSRVSISRIKYVLIELSFEDLYENQARWHEVATYLDQAGFRLRNVWKGLFTKGSACLLQADFLFQRK